MDEKIKKKIKEKMITWAEAKTCPSCKRKNALQLYPGNFGMIAVCRWCKKGVL